MVDCLTALAEAVKTARKKQGLTQVQLSEIVGADPRTIMNIENCNDNNPKMVTLVRLIQFFKLDANEIFYPREEEKSPALLELALNDCPEEEIRALVPICRCILDSIHSINRSPAV